LLKKGADIDTIAIVADVEKTGKRSHRYRVVMMKVLFVVLLFVLSQKRIVYSEKGRHQS
jgi:hypothetical protein